MPPESVKITVERSISQTNSLNRAASRCCRSSGLKRFRVRVSAGWEPVLNEEHDHYRWLTLADAIALARWPETKELLARVAESPV